MFLVARHVVSDAESLFLPPPDVHPDEGIVVKASESPDIVAAASALDNPPSADRSGTQERRARRWSRWRGLKLRKQPGHVDYYIIIVQWL